MTGTVWPSMVICARKKSEEPRVSPVCWFPGDNGSWLILASVNGAPKNPAWYYNLTAHPDGTP
ncbi:nitroreductase/quinone reductase family protein [Streptomyces acidicola]|uniref:nitroreductase/quinone reductase family protein n=1 Tax=Streptomyces acidicola TaxID=2596892 RepID=UPI00343EBA45